MTEPPINGEELLSSAVWLRSVNWRTETESTQLDARRFAESAEDAELPVLFGADQQTAGRGQGANAWHTARGSLAFTLALPSESASHPAVVPPQLPPWGLLAALSVACVSDDALSSQENAEQTTFHWPNDIYLYGKKLAGVLVERLASGRVLVGVGWNTRCRWDAAPPSVRSIAISLLETSPNVPTNQRLLASFLHSFRRQWEQSIQAPEAIASAVNAKWNVLGQGIEVFTKGDYVHGLAERINIDGALVLRRPSGTIHIVSGQIQTGRTPKPNLPS